MTTAGPAVAAPDSAAILERLTWLHPKIIDLSLDRIERLLERLGRPELALPPVVHVAGTNGKGSTIAYMRAALEAAGHRVHVYTSPHLVRFNERIRLAGRLIDDGALAALLEEVERANGDAPITFFEVTTAAAFLAFARAPADILLLETGLGGRLDATNVLARPALTAISPVALDHQQFLGDTLAAIAGEKAGILKPGVCGVIGPQPPEAAAVIARRAAEIGAPLWRHGTDWRAEAVAGRLRFRSSPEEIDLPLPALPGVHQVDNAGLALACLRRLHGFDPDDQALAASMLQAEWPARMQRLTKGPLADLLPPGADLWLDGGHNPSAGEAVAATLDAWARADPAPRPLHLVFAMLRSKDAAGYLAPFRALRPMVYTVAVPGEAASLTADDAAAAAQSLGLESRTMPDAGAAIRAIAGATGHRPQAPARILICGSLYFAGTILAEHG